MGPSRSLRRAVDRFLADPASIRIAAWLMVGATVTAVVVGGVVMRVFDHREYPNIGRAMWFTIQTVTTVGYGDVTPKLVIGRLVATVIMLTGIGFITLVTASITSVFVEAARQRATLTAQSSDARSVARAADLAALNARLDQIEETLTLLVDQTRPA
jgi:voltage-gated potassium channel